MLKPNQHVGLFYTYHSVWKGDHAETTITIINPPANEIEEVEWRWGFNGKANEYAITTLASSLTISTFVPHQELVYGFCLKLKGKSNGIPRNL